MGDKVLLRIQSLVQLDDYSEPEPDISHDESFIYKNRKSGNTVGSDEAIDLLVRKAKLSLFQYAERQESGKYKLGGALDALRKARNSIEHKEVALKPSEVKEFLGAAFVFLDTFETEDTEK